MSRWIDADALSRYLTDDWGEIVAADEIDNAPTIEIVRCKDCKWCLVEDGGCERIGMVLFADEIENHFCGYGKRKNDE